MKSLALFLFSHRTLATMRWDLHFIKVRFWNFLLRRHAASRRFAASRATPVLLNLGSGPRGLADRHWINVDCFRDSNVHFVLDFTRPLPFHDASFDGVFCEHVLEHFTLAEGERLLREVCRCLRPGGIVRIVVPDGEHIMRTYFDAPQAFDLGEDRRGSTPMEAVNSYFRQRYEHQFTYDFETLAGLLRRAGFARAVVSSFNDGEHPVTLDDPRYKWESLYVNAVK